MAEKEKSAKQSKWIKIFIFDSFQDVVRTIIVTVIVGILTFLWGNVLGLLYEKPRSLKVSLRPMGDYFEGYGFINSAFSDFEADTKNRIPLIFDPPELRKIRVCKEVHIKDTDRGLEYLRRIIDKYPQCLKLEIKEDTTSENRSTQAVVSKADKPSLLSSAQRDGKEHWFCGCDQRVLDEFSSNKKYP